MLKSDIVQAFGGSAKSTDDAQMRSTKVIKKRAGLAALAGWRDGHYYEQKADPSGPAFGML